jgi:hypothetical protein
VLIFYATAALHFPFTPDATYATARATHTMLVTGQTPLPFTPGIPWVMVSAAGHALRLDPILVVKVFSLLSSSLALLLVYLLAVEVADDRIFALCATLVICTQSWLLRWAASGGALGVIFVLVIAALFCLQRNDYLLAVVFIALTSLMAWQAAGMLVGVVVDVLVNSRDRRRGVMVAFASAMIFIAALLPWVLYATWSGLPIVTGIHHADPGLTGSAAAKATFAGAGLLALGLLLREPQAAERRHPLLQVTGMLLSVAWLAAVGLVWEGGFLLIALGVFIVLGFAGLARMLRRLSGDQPAYGPAILAAAALVLVAQLEFLTVTKPGMEKTIADNDDLISIAYWIRSGVPEGSRLAAERPGILSYTLGRDIPRLERTDRPEFLVSSAEEIDGYELAYTPKVTDQVPDGEGHFKIWRKK